MKKTLAILTALAVSAFCVNAYAQIPEQDNQLFNHWSVGVGIGLTEGVQFSAATTITPNLQVRLTYNTLSPVVSIADKFTQRNQDIGSINPFKKRFDLPDGGIHQNGVNIDYMDITAQLHSGEMKLLLDYFPSQTGSFHLTGGVIVDLSPDLVTATGTLGNNSGQPAMQPSDYGMKEFAGVTTDLEGNINIRASYGLKTIRPYLGIGFGRAVDLKRRVNVNFDMGVAYIGGIHAYSHSYLESYPNPTSVELNEAWTESATVDGKTVKEHLGQDAEEIFKYANLANGFPVLPYIRFTINCRLF